jgi:hypothetical protein
VIIISSKHKPPSTTNIDLLKRFDDLYRTESGWGEVDNCWGALGYLTVLVYEPLEYDDIVLTQAVRDTLKVPPTLLSDVKRAFRAERNADINVREQELGDLVAVALHNAVLPLVCLWCAAPRHPEAPQGRRQPYLKNSKERGTRDARAPKSRRERF